MRYIAKKWATLLLAAFMMMGLATGCSQPSNDTGSQPTAEATKSTEATQAPAKDDAAEATEAPTGDAATTGTEGGGTINLTTGADPKMLDLAFASDGESGMVIDRVFDSLMRYKPDGSVEPDLAESYTISDDGLVYTFKLRSGIKFHDGTDFNAEAIKWNFERQMGDNVTPDMTYASFFEKIDKLEVPDDLTFIVTLKAPDSTFLTYLAQKIGIGGICSPTAWQKDPEAAKRNPVGTGPYIFSEWVPDQYIVLTANKDYHLGAPKNDKLIIKVIKESSVRSSELVAGTVDLISNIDLNDVPMLQNTPGIVVDSKPGTNINYMAFVDYEKTDKIFHDERLRKAVWCAIDRDALIKALYGENGVVAKSIIPPTMLGGDADFKQTAYDPEMAKTLMAEAGYPDGFTFTLLTYNVTKGYNPAADRLAVALQNELAKVNIKATITIEPWSEYLTSTYAEDCKYDAVMSGWGAATNDTSYMFELLMSENAGTGANHAGYKNDVVDQCLKNAKLSTDVSVQREEYVKAAQQVNDDMPWLIISHGKDYWAYRDNLDAKGWTGVWGTHDEMFVKH